MTKAPIGLQELRRRIYRKAKSDKTHRFWGIFVHVTKAETLEEAYRMAKKNRGAPGVDGQTFEDVERMASEISGFTNASTTTSCNPAIRNDDEWKSSAKRHANNPPTISPYATAAESTSHGQGSPSAENIPPRPSARRSPGASRRVVGT